MTYNQIKEKYPATVILVRFADHYATYGKDAEIASKVLDLPLQDNECDIPWYNLEIAVPQLVRKGHRIAILDRDDIDKDV